MQTHFSLAQMADPNIERRQFGIVDLQGRSIGFSGSGNSAASLSAQGQVPGTDIYYSVQGNILASNAVVNKVNPISPSTQIMISACKLNIRDPNTPVSPPSNIAADQVDCGLGLQLTQPSRQPNVDGVDPTS